MSEWEDQYKYTWMLGDDSDCETCGMSWNEAGVELWDEEENIWQLFYRVGCTGGDSILSSNPDWDSKSEEMIKYLRGYEDFDKSTEKELRECLALIKEGKLKWVSD